MKHLIILFCFTFVAFAADKTAVIKYRGCGITKKAYMKELAAAFTKKYKVEVSIEGGGATKGIRSANDGEVDVGGSCRQCLFGSDAEKKVKLHPVAWDALAIIVNKNNPVKSITLQQLKDVMLGKVTNWKDLGGEDKTLHFFKRNGKISGVGRMARELIFMDVDIDFVATQSFKSSGPLEKAILKDTYGIAVTGISSARKRDVKVLGLDGYELSKENIMKGKYPLYRPLYLVTNKKPTKLAKKFIKFAKSKAGQKIISDQGTVNLREGKKLWPVYRKAMKALEKKYKKKK
ncbi:MAG: phosphate ABC transporter substrate-binding protein [Candidatus Cloacimonadota bacterium]|nr:MAG: phosphate ABC transporter substrate-binding protein [Candidatus Cloacimonadota bacterium]PCJ20146.1 MAG: phosphate ABC transporter substrate-binding protein [Candidatus Cloacimonadota bacterium]